MAFQVKTLSGSKQFTFKEFEPAREKLTELTYQLIDDQDLVDHPAGKRIIDRALSASRHDLQNNKPYVIKIPQTQNKITLQSV